jgi:hypothetical protein
VTFFQVLLRLLITIYLQIPVSRPFPFPNKDRHRGASTLLAAYSAGLQGWLGGGKRCLASLIATARHAVLVVPSVRHFRRISITGTSDPKNTS